MHLVCHLVPVPALPMWGGDNSFLPDPAAVLQEGRAGSAGERDGRESRAGWSWAEVGAGFSWINK